MRVSKSVRTGVAVMLGGVVALGGSVGIAQEASPEPAMQSSTEVVLENVDGEQVGTASFVELEAGVVISVEVEGFEPGDHGIHLHETGICDPSGDKPFSSAGGHFNPYDASHGPGPFADATPVAVPAEGTPAADVSMSHAGDLGNITIADDETGELEITTGAVTLAPGAENSLFDDDGSALVIHEDPDDLMTDPSGNSGVRIACGVIAPPVGGTPVATPDA